MHCWPSGKSIDSKESIEERVIREDAALRLFPALLAHDVLNQVWAIKARFVVARSRVARDIRVAVKAPVLMPRRDTGACWRP